MIFKDDNLMFEIESLIGHSFDHFCKSNSKILFNELYANLLPVLNTTIQKYFIKK